MSRMIALPPLLALAACTLGPDAHRPEVGMPAVWSSSAQDIDSRIDTGAVRADWWRSFDDPVLVSLVERLTARNIDLQVAAETIEQAQAQRRIAGADRLPRLGVEGGYMRNRVSENGLVGLLTPGTPGGANQIPSGSPPLDFDLFNAAGVASWEIDLFGRVRRSMEAARADVQAAQEARSSVALALVSELAVDYLELRAVQASEALAREAVAAATAREALVGQQVGEGAASRQQLTDAQAATHSARGALPTLEARRAALINAIGYMLAEPPQALTAELSAPAAPRALPASVPIGIPSDLILRRPDVREAEARLYASTARIGVAKAAFYPRITLFGLGGLQSVEGSNFFEWASRTFAVGPNISLPIFEGGKLRAQLRIAESQQRAAVLRFRAAVLQAWRDVDDSIAGYVAAQRAQAQAAAVDASRRKALDYARDQRREGATGDVEVIAARMAVVESGTALVEADAKVRASLVGLYKALGGGWEPIVAAAPGVPTGATAAKPGAERDDAK